MTGSGKREAGNVDAEPETHLLVHVQPRARRTEIVGWHGDAIKIRVAAPPVDRAANEAVLRYLASRLAVPMHALRLTSGNSGRRKRVTVTGLDATTVLDRLGIGRAPTL